jgi:hypothetical protein
LEVGVLVERLEIRIALHVGQIVVAQQDRPRERIDGVVGTAGPGQRAGQVVAGKKVPDELLPDLITTTSRQ